MSRLCKARGSTAALSRLHCGKLRCSPSCLLKAIAVMVFSFLNCLAVLDDGALLLEFLEAANIWALLHPEGGAPQRLALMLPSLVLNAIYAPSNLRMKCFSNSTWKLMHLLCYLLPQNCFCLWVDIRNIAGHRVHHTVLLEPQDENLVQL